MNTSPLQQESPQITSLWADIAQRPGRYLGDLRRCSPLSFGGGNISFAGATGAIGGFAIGAAPAMAVQAIVASALVYQQIRATYQGKNYNAPMKTLGIANLASAGLMVAAGIASGSSFGLVLAGAGASVFAVWGVGHIYLNRFIKRMETLQKQGQEKGLSPDDIKDTINNDAETAKMLNRFQICYGIGDIDAILNAAAHGNNIQDVAHNLTQSIGSWETLVPTFMFSLGLTKAFAEKTFGKLEAHMPNNLNKLFKTPNRAYAAGYGATTAIIAGKAAAVAVPALIAGNEWASVSATIDPIKTAGLLSAYGFWTHAYLSLDEAKPLPQSADDFARENGHLPSPTRNIA